MFCYGPYPTEKYLKRTERFGEICSHLLVVLCGPFLSKMDRFTTMFLYVPPCISFIYLLHLILLVKGKGKRSV